MGVSPSEKSENEKEWAAVPGTNLTREEAQERARLLTVDAYEIELDLSGAQDGGPSGR